MCTRLVAINTTTLRGNQICQISQMLRSYFYSLSIPRDSDSPRAITEAISVLPQVPQGLRLLRAHDRQSSWEKCSGRIQLLGEQDSWEKCPGRIWLPKY